GAAGGVRLAVELVAVARLLLHLPARDAAGAPAAGGAGREPERARARHARRRRRRRVDGAEDRAGAAEPELPGGVEAVVRVGVRRAGGPVDEDERHPPADGYVLRRGALDELGDRAVARGGLR